MKKICYILLIFALILGGILVLRSISTSTHSPYADITPGLVAQTQQIAYPAGTTDIVLTVNNIGSDLASFHPCALALEHRVDNQWHTLPSIQEADFSVLQTVQVGAPPAELTLDLTGYPQPLEPGNYRIVLLHDQGELCAVAEFSLGLEPTPSLNNIPWGEDDLFAIVYVGYRTITDWDADCAQYQEDFELGNIFYQYEMGGDECFLIIPRYQESELALYPRSINDVGEAVQDNPLYSQRNGNPFLLFCNPSDIFSNVAITISSVSETATFSPQLSLRDGYLSPVERGQDITLYDLPSEGAFS